MAVIEGTLNLGSGHKRGMQTSPCGCARRDRLSCFGGMPRLVFGALIACAVTLFSLSAAEMSPEEAKLTAALSFETGGAAGAVPDGWGGGPAGTVFQDDQVVHSGKGALRIERTAQSAQQFSSVAKMLPLEVAGELVELRGFIRTEDVTDFVGLWMRQDGEKPNLALENMQRRQVKGTTDWAEYRISLPVHPEGRRLVFGVLLSGTGRAWADDLQLLVDGKPILQAPKAARVLTVLDRDDEFNGGSKIALSELTPAQIANLATLAKVWGFLKYHHPKVTSGQLHWDFELFRVLPRVLAAPDRAAANDVLMNWVEALGAIGAQGPVAKLVEDELHLRPELAWLDDANLLGAKLIARLRAIHASRPAKVEQFYVSLVPGVRNPKFDRELSYANIKDVDAGFQLLGLFRYWNVIRYWSPYRDLVEGDWDAALVEFIPRIGLAKSVDAYQLELMALIARTSDTHANLWGSLAVRPPVGEAQVPVRVRFVEGNATVFDVPVLEGVAASGLQRGDVIEAVDGVEVAKLVREWAPYYAASNEPTRLRDIGGALLKGAVGPTTLRVVRGGEHVEVIAQREPRAHFVGKLSRTHDRPGEAFQRLSKDVAYLKLSAVKAEDAESYITRAAGTKGLILDIRNYPSASMMYPLGTRLVNEPTEFARFTSADLANPGAFYFGKTASLKPAPPHYAGRVVILVDEVSQSNSEYTAMALRAAPDAVVVGSTTAGADGNVSSLPLPGGWRTAISGIGVFYPDKNPTQRIGIVPDIEVKPTVAGIRAARDEVLEVAVREILGAEISADEIVRMTSEPPAPH